MTLGSMRFLAATTLSLALALFAASARATIVERVVAVVGERAILLSDVRERARPMLLRIYEEVPGGAQRAAAISQTYKTMLERMVDEELAQRAANRSRLVVSAQEVDDAIGRIAAQNNLTVDKLVAEATSAGLTESQYRNEIRRQVLEAKLVNLRIQGRIRITEDDVRTAYRKLVMEERRKLRFRAAWIRLDLPAGASRDVVQESQHEAERLAGSARQGADFAALARQHSADTATRDAGGVLGNLRPGLLPRAVDIAVQGLEPGQVSEPVRAGSAYYVVKLLERDESQLPSYEEARDELSERIYVEKMNKARRTWFDSLRRQTHVEIRL